MMGVCDVGVGVGGVCVSSIKHGVERYARGVLQVGGGDGGLGGGVCFCGGGGRERYEQVTQARGNTYRCCTAHCCTPHVHQHTFVSVAVPYSSVPQMKMML